MRCDEVQDLASAWLDNELSDARARVLAEHETQCEACRAYVTDLRTLAEQMKRLGGEPVPAGLEDRIRATLAEAHDDGASVVPFAAPGRWRGFIQQAASMAAVCLLSVFGTWAVVQRPDTVPTTRHDVVCRTARSRSHRAIPIPYARGSMAAWSSRRRLRTLRPRDSLSLAGGWTTWTGIGSRLWSIVMDRIRSACSFGRRRSHFLVPPLDS
jgi:hypothetical protein